MVIWELWHQSLPFDNDVVAAQTYVLKEESRPKIIQSMNDREDEDIQPEAKNTAYSNDGQKNLVSILNDTQSGKSKICDDEDSRASDYTFCDQIISIIIRKCWQ